MEAGNRRASGKPPREGGPGPVAVAFGEQIRSVQRDRGLTVRAFAERLHVSHGFLSDVQAGKAKPSPGLVAQIDELGGLNGARGGVSAAAGGVRGEEAGQGRTAPAARQADAGARRRAEQSRGGLVREQDKPAEAALRWGGFGIEGGRRDDRSGGRDEPTRGSQDPRSAGHGGRVPGSEVPSLCGDPERRAAHAGRVRREGVVAGGEPHDRTGSEALAGRGQAVRRSRGAARGGSALERAAGAS